MAWFCRIMTVHRNSEVAGRKKHNIQISLDGDKDTHNFLRPNVDFDHVMDAIKNISSLGLTFGINLTVNKYNYEK